MYSRINQNSLEQRLGNNSLTPLRGIEEEFSGKSYLWVRDWKRRTNIVIIGNDLGSQEHRCGLRGWVQDKVLFGTYERADQFYERAFQRLLPSEKPEKVHAFIESMSDLYGQFIHAKENLHSQIPKKFLYNAISSIFSIHMVEFAFLGIGAYLTMDSWDPDFAENMQMVRLLFGTAATVVLAKATASTLGGWRSEMEDLARDSARSIHLDPLLKEFISPSQIEDEDRNL